MAYAESTVGGSLGGNYRVWVNSIRTYDGNPAENYENWRAEGGLNKIGGGTAFNGYNNASYTLQLGLNGVSSSGNFSYNFGSGTGTVLAWGTGTTSAYRNSAGVGYGFQSRMDIDLANSPYLTSGWVTSNDTVQTKYRQATLTAAPNFTDEENPVISYSNPAGNSVNTLMAGIYDSAGSTSIVAYRSVSKTGSSYTFTLTGPEEEALQAYSSTSNTKTVQFKLRTNVGGSDFFSTLNRTLTIVNANPVFSDFDYEDTNSATVAVTGDNQVIVAGLSDLEVTVDDTDAAVAQKEATRSSYNVTIGAYSSSSEWPASGDMVHDVGLVTGVSGLQSLGVRAVDSRGNGTLVSKNVEVLPYNRPGFYIALYIKYANNFDATDGLEAGSFDSSSFGIVWPLTVGGVDKNVIDPANGAQFDISKGNNTSYSGTWTDIATTQASGTGVVSVDFEQLADDILTRMDALDLDNTVRWYIKFRMTDEFNTSEYTKYIDVGRPILRIGADGNLYHKEVEFYEAFNPQKRFIIPPAIGYGEGSGTWVYGYATGYSYGTSIITNSSNADLDYCRFDVFLNVGSYDMDTIFSGGANRARVQIYIAGYNYGGGILQDTVELYNATTTQNTYTLNNITISTAGWYSFVYRAFGHHASSTGYTILINSLIFRKDP